LIDSFNNVQCLAFLLVLPQLASSRYCCPQSGNTHSSTLPTPKTLWLAISSFAPPRHLHQ
jgi:hypothetical protein